MILFRYILAEIARAFAVVLAGLTLALVVANGYVSLRDLQGSSGGLLLRLAPALAILALPHALAISLMAGVTLAYGRLAGDREIEAMRVAGARTWSLLLPAWLFALPAAAAVLLLLRAPVPQAHRAQRRIIAGAALEILRDPPPGPRLVKLGGLHLSYARTAGRTLEGVELVDFSGEEQGVRTEISAREAWLAEGPDGVPVLRMRTIRQLHRDLNAGRTHETLHESLERPLEEMRLSGPRRRPKYATGAELPPLFTDRRYGAEARTEWHARIARGLDLVLLAPLAALAGMLVRSSNRLAGLGASLPAILGYLLLRAGCDALGASGTADPALAAWAPTGACAVAAAAARFALR